MLWKKKKASWNRHKSSFLNTKREIFNFKPNNFKQQSTRDGDLLSSTRSWIKNTIVKTSNKNWNNKFIKAQQALSTSKGVARDSSWVVNKEKQVFSLPNLSLNLKTPSNQPQQSNHKIDWEKERRFKYFDRKMSRAARTHFTEGLPAVVVDYIKKRTFTTTTNSNIHPVLIRQDSSNKKNTVYKKNIKSTKHVFPLISQPSQSKPTTSSRIGDVGKEKVIAMGWQERNAPVGSNKYKIGKEKFLWKKSFPHARNRSDGIFARRFGNSRNFINSNQREFGKKRFFSFSFPWIKFYKALPLNFRFYAFRNFQLTFSKKYKKLVKQKLKNKMKIFNFYLKKITKKKKSKNFSKYYTQTEVDDSISKFQRTPQSTLNSKPSKTVVGRTWKRSAKKEKISHLSEANWRNSAFQIKFNLEPLKNIPIFVSSNELNLQKKFLNLRQKLFSKYSFFKKSVEKV